MENTSYRSNPQPRAQPETRPIRVLDALSLVHEQALQGHALGRKTKELIALATSVVTGCDTSIAYHLHNALEAGATREEMVEAVEVALVTAGEPAAVHAAQIFRAMDLDEAERFAAETDDLLPQGLRARASAHPYMPPD